MRISIIIPTHNPSPFFEHKVADFLRPCVESVFRFSAGDFRVIVVANGCGPKTHEYLFEASQKYPNLHVITSTEQLYYVGSINRGIELARSWNSDFFIALNDDTVILESPINDWLDRLTQPMIQNPKIGITGPLSLHSELTEKEFIVGFCFCFSKLLLATIGPFDPALSIGMHGDDIDYCAKAQKAGFEILPLTRPDLIGNYNCGNFPIFHKGSATTNHAVPFSQSDWNKQEIRRRKLAGEY